MRNTSRRLRTVIPSMALFLLISSGLRAASPAPSDNSGSASSTNPMSLVSYNMQDSNVTKEKTTVVTHQSSDNHWEIDGPVFLRSADPEPPGEVIVKNIFGWDHSKKKKDKGSYPWDYSEKRGDRDEYEYELEVEWGVVENHELIFKIPVQLGDGRVDGNGDLTIGWHWRLWDEQEVIPAFAMRNFVRLPTGIDSSGVDYEIRGLFTKTIVPGSTRLHLNPYAKSVNGDNEEDAEDFQYGAAIGVDHRLSDNLLFITDYIYASEETEDAMRANHEAEFGLDWEFAEHQKLGIAFNVGLDGDTDGPEFGAEFSYMLSFGG